MTKKPSLEEYKEIGREMTFLNNRLTSLYVKVANDIGVSKKESEQLKKAVRDFSKCKSDLEDLMFSQYSFEEGGTPKIFYGDKELPSDLQYKKE